MTLCSIKGDEIPVMYKKLIETYDWVSLFILLFHSDYNVVIGITKPYTNEIFTKREARTSEKLDKVIRKLLIHHEIDYRILKDKFQEPEVEMAYVNIYDIEDYVLQLVTYKNKPNELFLVYEDNKEISLFNNILNTI